MGLTTSQSVAYERIRSSSTSKQAVPLSYDAIRGLVYIAARDLELLEGLPEPQGPVPELFDPDFLEGYELDGESPKELFAALCDLSQEADTYVGCLASLHKARLKYQKVLATQPFARMDQVGPRGLLQYGLVEVGALAGLLVWRKWIYDVDNRAAQDTGYLVEPVLAGAIGGTPYHSKSSPIKRRNNPKKGRQVDCIKDDLAYEFKLRMTIAASGQGRWTEELDFAEDCRDSGYTPVLMVLDPTPSVKLDQLKAAFEDAGGRCWIGDDAWQHLYDEAKEEMRGLIRKYVEVPLRGLFEALDEDAPLPRFELHDHGTHIEMVVGDASWVIKRDDADPALAKPDVVPEDAGDFLPGFD